MNWISSPPNKGIYSLFLWGVFLTTEMLDGNKSSRQISRTRGSHSNKHTSAGSTPSAKQGGEQKYLLRCTLPGRHKRWPKHVTENTLAADISFDSTPPFLTSGFRVYLPRLYPFKVHGFVFGLLHFLLMTAWLFGQKTQTNGAEEFGVLGCFCNSQFLKTALYTIATTSFQFVVSCKNIAWCLWSSLVNIIVIFSLKVCAL